MKRFTVIKGGRPIEPPEPADADCDDAESGEKRSSVNALLLTKLYELKSGKMASSEFDALYAGIMRLASTANMVVGMHKSGVLGDAAIMELDNAVGDLAAEDLNYGKD